MRRKIVIIDEDKCNGCGDCIPNCHEGALQIIDGKARLISDLFCDGLGACLGHCPQGAIAIEEREAGPYDERTVMDAIIKGGKNVIIAHLTHLSNHNETAFLNQALDYLKEKQIPIELEDINSATKACCTCEGSKEASFEKENRDSAIPSERRDSQLDHWPVQLHLVNPVAAHYHEADVLLAADCTAFATTDFHRDFITGKSIAIACPKLDSGKDIYVNKLVAMLNEAGIKSLTVVIMEVPCCRGLLQLAQHAINLSGREIPLRLVVLSIRGEVISDKAI
ncbi:MAG: 4Fe-4S dicluster domain-containing protein [Ignavibacteria bacterium]